MDLKYFCDGHWSTEPHGAEPTKRDSGDRELVFAPEGETCSFCDQPATHTGPWEAPPPAPTKKSIKPEPLVEPAPTRKSMRP